MKKLTANEGRKLFMQWILMSANLLSLQRNLTRKFHKNTTYGPLSVSVVLTLKQGYGSVSENHSASDIN